MERLCQGGSLSRGVSVKGVSVQGGLCPGDLCPGGSLSTGAVLPRYGKEQAVRILLECILVSQCYHDRHTYYVT